MSTGLFNYMNGNNSTIDTSTWKSYEIQNLFNVETSVYHDPENLEDGSTPYVSRTIYNNGITKNVSYDGLLYPGNCITIGAESAKAFYQDQPFITGNKIYRLYAKADYQLNKYIALYLCTVLNKIGKDYSYTDAWTSSKIKTTAIFLPTTNTGPDWLHMESFMKSHYDILNEILM